jgi:class 3 adenylate cyclase/tetratricopeptide (TPR) repeat protein
MASDVTEWLKSLGLENYSKIFCENEIDLTAARELTDSDLREIDLPMGPRKKLLLAIEQLRDAQANATELSNEVTALPRSAERRQLTVVFCDLVGSTSLASRLDLEEMRDVLIRYHDTVAGTIVRYDGYVANYLGDGIIAYFGWPRATEDQTEQALRAGLSAVVNVSQIPAPDGKRLATRVGIATGQVVVGDLEGQTARQLGAISGETPNLASRLQSEANFGEVVIDSATHALVTGKFKFTDLAPKSLKGIAEPVIAYRVEAEMRAESRFEAQPAHDLTPFVGRRSELSLLEERWAVAAAGEGQVVMLSGEPGIGKSRLSRQLLERIAEQPHFRLRYQCSPQHRNSAFYPIIRQLEHAARIDAADRTVQRFDKLEAMLREGGSDVSQSAPLIAEMMALPIDRYATQALSPQRQKELLFDALADQLLGLASSKPVLILVEDAHWIDPSSLEAFGAIATRVEELPVLLLITARPEFDPPWAIGGHISRLSLARLSKRHCGDFVRSIIGQNDLDRKIIDKIVARTDGIPLFIEEFARVLNDNEATDNLEIPATLQALISSRLDQVSPTARAIAQVGSILGREFTFEIVQAIGDQSADDIEAAIDELGTAGLVTHRGPVRKSKIVFKHALIEEAAYNSQLNSIRRERHRQAAEYYEERAIDGGGAEPEVIAHHFTRGGEPIQALPHLFAAAKRANSNCAYHEGIAHLQSGLDIIRADGTQNIEQRWHLPFLTSLGNEIMALRGYADRQAGEIFREALQICPENVNTDVRFSILWNLWLYNQMSANLPEARRMIETMAPLARNDSPDVQRLQFSHAGWTTAFSNGDLNSAKSHLAVGLSLYSAEEHHSCTFVYGGHDPGVCAQCHCAFVQSLSGNVDAGDRCGEMALTLAEKLGHENSLTIAYAFGSLGRYFVRDAAGARDLSEKAIALAKKYGPMHFEVLANCVNAWAGEFLNEKSDSVELLREGIERSMSSGAVMRTPFYALMLAEVLCRRGIYDKAAETISTAFTIMKRYQASVLLADAFRIRGEIESQLGLNTEAAISFGNAIDRARQQGARLLELRSAVCQVRAQTTEQQFNPSEVLLPILQKMNATIEIADITAAHSILARDS